MWTYPKGRLVHASMLRSMAMATSSIEAGNRPEGRPVGRHTLDRRDCSRGGVGRGAGAGGEGSGAE